MRHRSVWAAVPREEDTFGSPPICRLQAEERAVVAQHHASRRRW